jgi:hypothetical protein
MLKFTYKDRFLTIKIAYDKLLITRFLVVFQNFVVGQILANLGNFGQFWAVADSMPELGLKS